MIWALLAAFLTRQPPLVQGVVLFVWGLESQKRHGWNPSSPPPRWLYAVYVVVWLPALAATLYTLFGAGGFKVAVLAIVPLVLLAPTAIRGAVTLSHRGPARAG